MLLRLKASFGDRVELLTFGCSGTSLQETLKGMRAGDRANSVHHLGVLARDEVAQLFADSDVFLDGSVWQAFGRTGLEAMAAGCVPVLPAGSGCEEYARHGVNAMLVDTTDAEAMYRATASLVADRTLLGRLHTAAIQTAREFDMEHASHILMRLLCASVRGDIVPAPCSRAKQERTPSLAPDG